MKNLASNRREPEPADIVVAILVEGDSHAAAIESTPFETELVARRVAALFEAIDAGEQLKVEPITEIEGQRRSVAGFGGSAGAIFQDPIDPIGQRSGAV